MRAPRWCRDMKVYPLVLLFLTSPNLRAADLWDPAYGYREPLRQAPNAPVGDLRAFPQGSWDAYSQARAPTNPPAVTTRSGLYEKLRSDPGLDPVHGKGRDPTDVFPGFEQRSYRFRGDGPVDKGYPNSAGEYRYRPLTAQERDRGQTSPGWRPLTAPRRDSTSAPTPYPDSWPGGWNPGPPPDVRAPVVPTDETENWYERTFPRAGAGGR